MAAAELPRPGVEVVQVIRTTTPTVVTPTLVPCVVGVAKQVVELLETDSSGSSVLNGDALIALPAFFLALAASGTPAVYSGLNGLHLDFDANNGVPVVALFSDPTASGLTPVSVVTAINAALAAAGVTSAQAEVVGNSFRLRTVATGQYQSIRIHAATSPAVLTAFGIGANRTYSGVDNYAQLEDVIPATNFPDPRGNLAELSIESSSIRAFLAMSASNFLEVFRDEAFLRRGSIDTAAVLTGTGDLDVFPAVAGTAAVLTGTGDLDPFPALTGLTLIAALNGVSQTVNLTASQTDTATLLALLNGVGGFTGIVASINTSTPSTPVLVLTSSAVGATITIGAGTANTAFGFTPAQTNTGTAALTLIVTVGTGTPQTVSLAGVTSTGTLTAAVNSGTAGITATIDSTVPAAPVLVLTSEATGGNAMLTVGNGTANTALGFTNLQTNSGTSIQVVDDGNGDNFSPLLYFAGADFTAVGTAASVVGTLSIATPVALAGTTLELSDGQQLQTITFSAAATDAAHVLSEINAVMGPAAGGRMLATANGTSYLVLTSTQTGADSMVWVKSGTALTILGLTANTLAYGALGHVEAGDELFIDGMSKGLVTAVAPGGQVDRLKINSQQVITLDAGASWHIMAKNLTGTGVDRPAPDLVVDANKTVVLKHTLLRDVVGAPIHPTQGRAPVYLSYTAIRKDVTSLSSNPGLLRIDNQTQLESALSPIDTRNPLALGLFFALVNAPGVQITGLGVDSVSADSPFGTAEAFTRAAEFLEAYEVYAIAPLSHDQTVGQIFNTHVSFMSEPAQKGERIALFNSEQPSTAVDTLVTSGADGNSVGSTGLLFDTGVPNLSALLMNKGVNPIGTIAVGSGVFLDIASDSKNYSISAVNGSVVTIRTTFAAGTNDDSFYSTTALNAPPLLSQLIAETFAIRIRGAALVTVDGSVDKQKVAETYAAIGQSYGNRRFWHTAPDSCAATVGGIEQVINGFYMNAGIVGMIGQQPPQQSFTNFPMSGYTRVIGSSNYFSERQMNIMAAGGTYIVVQDAQNAPLISRMALTTDLTSVETRTDSITKVVDFVAKFLRRGLKNFIGRFNITQAFLDQLGTVIGGLGGFLVEVGVLVGFNLNNIIQDEDSPDTVLVDVLVDPPYPCNYIRITLVI